MALIFLAATPGWTHAQSGAEQWDFTTAYLIDASPVVGAEGAIYVPSYENIYAMTPGGSNLWISATNYDGIYGSPAIGPDGTIYFGGASYGYLYALDPVTGMFKWTNTTAGDTNSELYYTSPAIGPDGTIYLGGYTYSKSKNALSHFYAFNPDGTVKWSYVPGGPIYSSAAISPDGATIYFGCDDGKVYALSTNGTTLRWTFNTGSYAITASPAIGADGKIYIGVGSMFNPKFYGINPDGTTNWVFTCTNRIQSSAAIGDDGTIYFGSDDMHLYALNPDGTLKWAAFTGATNASSPAIAADGTIYLGSDNGNLYAFNTSGSNVWTFATGGTIFSSPVIGTNGTIYVGSEDAKIYALNGRSGLAKVPWPMFRHDVRHTAQSVAITNTPPQIAPIANQTNNQNTTIGPLAFAVSDMETPAVNLLVGGVSSNPALVPNAQLVFSGAGSSRFLTLVPATNQTGTTLITVTVTDAAGATSSTSFLLTVLAVNHPPVLVPVTNCVIGAGVTLVVTNTATDPDLPVQTLAFSLPVAPIGASITTNSGVFVWRPGVAQANTTNAVSVVVTDNGSPSMSATQSFWVTVNPLARPMIRTASVTNGQCGFTISGDYGPDYLIQASTNLADWTSISTNSSPALPFTWSDTNSGGWPLRFYRIVLEP